MTTSTPLPPLEDLQADWTTWIDTISANNRWRLDQIPLVDLVAFGRFAYENTSALLTHLATLTARAQAAEGECARLREIETLREQQYAETKRAAKEALKCMQFRTQSSAEFGNATGALFSALDRLERERATLARPASGPGEAVAWQYRRIGDVMWETWAWPSKPVGYAPENWEMRPLYAVPPADGYAKAEAVETAFRMGFMYGQGAKSSFTADDAWSLSETKLRTECKESDHA